MSIKCIDVSEHQGKINWTKVKKSGIDHVIIRAGYGKNNIDSQWKNNIEGAMKAGITNIGVYWFSYAYTLTMAVAEANYCYEAIKKYNNVKAGSNRINLGVYFDWEYDSMRYAKKMKVAVNKDRITNMTKAFCERIKALGLIPGFYYNYDYKKNYYDLAELPYVNWYALDKSNGEFKSVAIQQYGVESIPGIKGKTDVNWIHKDIAPVKTDIPSIPKRGYFKKGDEGPAVKWIQKKLNTKNKMSDTDAMKKLGYKLEVNGIFDEKTEKALKLFQDVTHIKVDGKAGVISLTKLNERSTNAKRRAVNFAVAIARDDSFAYGTGDRAHHNGCYFCGTNINGPKKAKKGDKWEKTYCCNPFVHAAYAHGTGDAKMLKACKAKKAGGLTPGEWKKFNFSAKKAKDVKFSDLKVGDLLLLKNSHISMYTGGDYIVEASGGTWDPKSIAHKKIAKSRFKDYARRNDTYVLHYKG